MRFCRIATVVFIMAVWSTAAFGAVIKIGVEEGITSGTLTGSGTLVDKMGKRASFSGKTSVTAAGDSVAMGQYKFAMPVRMTGNDIGWNTTRYRGDMVLVPAKSGFTVVNELEMEQYMRGILKMEVNPAWHQEALKAQAILARTYGLKNVGKHGSAGFDLCDNTHCQVYRGVNAEDPATDKAVSDTAGMVIYYEGALASTFYHSDSGGYTADSSEVWSGSIPYLIAKPEAVSYQSPYSSWQATLSQAQMDSIMNKLKVNVGAVISVNPVARDKGGRVTNLAVSGTNGTANVEGHDFRMAAGSDIIRSTRFEVGGNITSTPRPTPVPTPVPQAQNQNVPMSTKEDVLVQLTKQNVFSKEELMDMLLYPNKRSAYISLGMSRIKGGGSTTPAVPMAPFAPFTTTTNAPSNVPSGVFMFTGQGWGHGVGLSQWGAKAAADQGWSASQIIAYYFPGTSIKTVR